MDDCSNNVRVQDENTPLLSSSEESGATTPCAKCVRPIKQWLVLIVGFAFILLIDLGGFLGAPAQTQIFENIICRHHYAQARHMPQQAVKDLDEAACKIDPVQTELAFINGWKDTFDVLPGIYQGVIPSCPINVVVLTRSCSRHPFFFAIRGHGRPYRTQTSIVIRSFRMSIKRDLVQDHLYAPTVVLTRIETDNMSVRLVAGCFPNPSCLALGIMEDYWRRRTGRSSVGLRHCRRYFLRGGEVIPQYRRRWTIWAFLIICPAGQPHSFVSPQRLSLLRFWEHLPVPAWWFRILGSPICLV